MRLEGRQLLELRARRLGLEHSGIRGRARAAIAANAVRGEFGAAAVVDALGIRLRTLQRQLQREGVSLRELLDEARHAQAQHLLGDGRLSIKEVSQRLGYTTPSAFGRAYHRWEGQSPGDGRTRLQAERSLRRSSQPKY